MHVHFLDPYLHRQSPVHQLDPRLKLALALAFILTTALAPSGAWPAYLLLLAIILSMEILSEVSVAYVLKRALLAAPFVLAALPLLFSVPGETIFNLQMGSWLLAGTLQGLERFASIAVKSWISVQAAILLAACTPFPDLLVAMRALHTPRLLVAIFGLMWRYLFVLVDEALRLLRARAARSSQAPHSTQQPGGSVAWRARVAGGMAGNLFLRAIDRSDRIYMAMLARGYDGEARTMPLPALSKPGYVILALGLAVLGAILGLAYLT